MAKPVLKPQATKPTDDGNAATDRKALEDAVMALTDQPVPPLHEGTMMIGEQVLIVSAPAGPRRRANLAFGPEPRELRWDELGHDPEAKLEALRRDPMIKIDGRMESRPATPEDLSQP